MGIRFVLAGAMLFVFLRARGAAMPTPKQWHSAVIVGVLLLVFGMGSVAMAEQWVSSGLAAALVATVPLWALAFSALWRNFPTRSEWLGVGLGFVGVAILTLEGNLQANPLGVALMLFATASWALGSVWMRRLDMPPGAMGNAAEMLAGGVILLIVGLLRGEQITGAPTTNALLALTYLTTFGSLATLTAYMYLLKTVSPALATSYTFVNPPIALLLGVLLGGEHLTGSAVIALPVILLGVAFVLRARTGSTG
jgi:drug/metabolite transporter (DMT)-like permease